MEKPTALEQTNKPNAAFINIFPNAQDNFLRNMRMKAPVTEEHQERPIRDYATCGVEQFALSLCSRNMTQKYAWAHCFKEREDYAECMLGTKRAQRAKKLIEASARVGDRIPELYGNAKWTY